MFISHASLLFKYLLLWIELKSVQFFSLLYRVVDYQTEIIKDSFSRFNYQKTESLESVHVDGCAIQSVLMISLGFYSLCWRDLEDSWLVSWAWDVRIDDEFILCCVNPLLWLWLWLTVLPWDPPLLPFPNGDAFMLFVFTDRLLLLLWMWLLNELEEIFSCGSFSLCDA